MGDKERIFLADDDPLFLDAVKFGLEDRGHTVVAVAASKHQARKILDNPDVIFRVAILDDEMPREGDGAEVAAHIREHRPGAVIISLSAKLQDYGDYNLSKKEDSEVLLETIREA